MDISECYVSAEGKTEYRCLYRYNITENDLVNGEYRIKGEFEKVSEPSEHLQTLLIRAGAPKKELAKYTEKQKAEVTG